MSVNFKVFAKDKEGRGKGSLGRCVPIAGRSCGHVVSRDDMQVGLFGGTERCRHLFVVSRPVRTRLTGCRVRDSAEMPANLVHVPPNTSTDQVQNDYSLGTLHQLNSLLHQDGPADQQRAE